jgi:hypothetical protein
MNADIDRKRGRRLASWVLAIVLGGVLLMSAPARAADIVVTSPGDDGTATAANCPGAGCRLRDAVAAASGGDRIIFDATAFAAAQTIQLTGGAIVIDKPLTIDGAVHGGATPTIGGPGAGAAFRLFDITDAATLRELTLRDGNAGSGNGGAIRTTAPLTLTAVTILSSTAYYGGGVYAEANVVVSDSHHRQRRRPLCQRRRQPDQR